MREMLAAKNWDTSDVDFVLNVPLSFVKSHIIDEEGWARFDTPGLYLDNCDLTDASAYKSVDGLEIDHNNGEINFVLEQCDSGESGALFTFLDIEEHVRLGGLPTGAVFR